MRAVALSALLLMVTLTGCMQAPGGEMREAWRSERPPATQVGDEGSFSFHADEWHLTGDMDLGLLHGDAGITFVPQPIDESDWLFMPGARLPGLPSGVLAIRLNGTMETIAGQIAGFSATAAHGGPCFACLDFVPGRVAIHEGPPTIDLPPGNESVERAYQQARFVAAQLTDVTLRHFDKAILVHDGQVTNITEDTITGLDAPGWLQGAGLLIQPSMAHHPVEVRMDRFALAGDLTGMTRTSGHGNIPDPAGVFGGLATLHLEGDRVWSDQGARITQVLRGEEPVFEAVVQFSTAEPIVTVEQGGNDWVAVNYRESGYVGDAILEDIQISGRGADMVRVPTRSEWVVEDLWRIVLETAEDEPWAAPFVAIPVAIATPFALIAEAASCVFGECPQAHPFPVWMSAADVGVFYVKVDADARAGDYDVLVWMHGRNFDTETFTFTIRVT